MSFIASVDSFPTYLYVKTNDTWGVASFNPGENILNNLGKGPPDNATHQISEMYALQFWLRFIKCFLSVAIATIVLHGIHFSEQF